MNSTKNFNSGAGGEVPGHLEDLHDNSLHEDENDCQEKGGDNCKPNSSNSSSHVQQAARGGAVGGKERTF